MYIHKEPLDVLIDGVINELTFFVVQDDIDQVAVFGVGHSKDVPDDAYDESGNVTARGYVQLDFSDVQELLYDEYVTGVKASRISLEVEDDGMHLTKKAITSYVLGEFLDECDSKLASVCHDLMVQGKWDTAIREAMLLVETRLRNLSDSANWGVDLVNECLGQRGKLASKFKTDSERQGFRDLFAGAMGVIRNDYAHNFKTPSRHEAVTTIQFADMLLKKLATLG